jgi:type I restriction-modification system DNA methylase subunit
MKRKSTKTRYSESRSRTYTLSELKALGWDVSHPAKGGNILEEHEAKHFDPRFDELLGRHRPDFLLYHKNRPVAVIENKDDRDKIDEAVTDAIDYAQKLSKKYFDVQIIAGVAGNNESGVIVKTSYRRGKRKWEEIKGNGYQLTQLLTLNQLEQVLLNKSATIDLKIPSESEFYKIAERINQILHDAHVNKSDRAVYLGAILLALKEGNVDTSPNVIIQQINANVGSALDSCGKSELKSIIRIRGGSAKLRRKLPLVFHNLDRLNIKALMNTGADVLGKFFETFLRYGNDAKELGIVFTPRHVIRFMCELVEVSPSDIVYDPACGTGGFLIGAFNRMKEQLGPNKRRLEGIKLNQLIGCDSDDSGKIPALAVVNMIFRGDGKSNIYNENCFAFHKFGRQFATKVLMNPPFAQTDEPETMFIEHGIESLKEGDLLATIGPYSIMSQKSLGTWRKNLIREHTLVAAITMPYNLFYPTSSSVCILVFKAHVPHTGKVWFCRIDNDGLKIKRKKRVECPGEQLTGALTMFKARDLNVDLQEEPGFVRYCDLDPNDDTTEFSPEAYLPSRQTSEKNVQDAVDQLLREFAAFNIKYSKSLRKLKGNN